MRDGAFNLDSSPPLQRTLDSSHWLKRGAFRDNEEKEGDLELKMLTDHSPSRFPDSKAWTAPVQLHKLH